MKILGIDYGRKYIGLAMTDEDGGMAFPFKTLEVNGRKQLFAELEKMIEYEGVRKVVVGLPLTMKGEKGVASAEVRKFICELEELSNVPIDFMDERLSTQEAEKTKAAGFERNGHAIAAQLLLDAYLKASHTP